MNPRAKNVQVLDQYCLKIEFANGEFRVFDVAPLLDYPVYAPLKKREYFERVFVANGVVQWPGEEDIAPDLLYLDSQPSNVSVTSSPENSEKRRY